MMEITMSNKKEKFIDLLDSLSDAMVKIACAETDLHTACRVAQVSDLNICTKLNSFLEDLSVLHNDMQCVSDGLEEAHPELCDDN